MLYLNYPNVVSPEVRIGVDYDGVSFCGLPSSLREALSPSIVAIFNVLQRDFPMLEQICVGGMVSEGGGECNFAAFDIYMLFPYGGAFLGMERSRNLFSEFGLKHYVLS
ncbi:MAG: hypothetical protein IKN13_00815 [Bacteroidales bacterium]|nr:hypothetical protein [Bacteroidales bacterium]